MKNIDKKIFKQGIFALCSLLVAIYANGARAAEFDTEDPMYFEGARELTVRGDFSVGDEIMGAGFKGSYGINDLFVLGTTVKYQQDFDNDRNYDGFSHVSVDMMYRMSNNEVKSDIFGGIKFSGDADPRFDNTIYSGGVRLGRQWDKATISGTLKTSWIFDELGGMAWIDFMPDAYFRLNEEWRLGFGFDFRKSTNPDFDATIMDMKLVRQYGRTQYVGFVDYDFEQNYFKVGTRVNISF